MKTMLKAKTKNLIVQKIKGETLIYDLSSNKAFCLNETSSLIWKLCNGSRTPRDIGYEIRDQLKTSVSEDLVWFGLDQLNRDGLIEGGQDISRHFSGLSRREVIRKVAYSSVIALPLVSSLVAPEAIMAQSGGILLDICPPNCSTGLTCVPTTVGASGAPSTPTGISQCCVGIGGRTPGSTYCVGAGTCAGDTVTCCSGSASPTSSPGCGFASPCICN